MVQKFGFELVDAEWLPVHGGELRYYITRPGRRAVAPRIAELLAKEKQQGLHKLETLQEFATKIERNSQDLQGLMSRLGREGQRVVAYGATAKSATVANYCGIGPDLVSAVYDTTPGKQGLLTPGMHIPVRPMAEFGPPYPDYALLFAWNFAEETIAKERAYRGRGGKWILYVPDVHIV